jgi:glucan endo-1,3-alpha-glucosidase
MSLGKNKFHDFLADASGPALGSMPFPEQLNGDRPIVAIMQNNKTAYYGEGSKPVTSWCSTKNFNPVVNLVGQGSANRGHS